MLPQRFPQAANRAPAVTDYREINALQKNSQRARNLATFLFKLKDIAWTDWELDFLENMSGWTENPSTRQGEKLVELSEASIWHETIEGFSLRVLADICYCARLDLSDQDADFFERVKASGVRKFRRRDAARVLRCARQLGEIEPHQGWTLCPPIPKAV
jgi:hypothetical protein